MTAPKLPATTLTRGCYYCMFGGCTLLAIHSLTDTRVFFNRPIKLPAMTLAPNCYKNMFEGCTTLIKTPELPATTLAERCYESMFQGCSMLQSAPDILPARHLKPFCYSNMFSDCIRLQVAPELPALSVPSEYVSIPTGGYDAGAYSWMFYGCSSLRHIKMSATELGDGALRQWVSGVASIGTFVKNTDATWDITGVSGVPVGWNIHYDIVVEEEEVVEVEGIKFTAVDDSVDLSFNNIGNLNFQHSYDGVTYNNWDGTALTIKPDESVYIRGDNSTICGKDADIRFMTSGYGKLKCEGNIMHLLGIISNIIPAEYCFYGLFENCTNLITAPELPATTLTLECYVYMFRGCINLINAPELPATALSDNCYFGMFSGCTSLTTAPELRATTLTNGCYYEMFNGCTSLTTAPELPATTLANDCYGYMFNECNKLNYIKMMATNISASNCLNWWVNNVASTGTFVKNVAASLPTGADGIPEGWTVVDYAA